MKVLFLKGVFILVMGLLIGGLSLIEESLKVLRLTFYYGVLTVLSMLPLLPTNIFDVFEQIIRDEWTLTNIMWFDMALLNVAAIAPSIALFGLAKAGFKIKGKFATLLSFLVFVWVLQLFGSVLFWSVLSACLLLLGFRLCFKDVFGAG